MQKDAILHANRRQLTAADAEKGLLGGGESRLLKGPDPGLALASHEGFDGRKEITLPGVGTHGEAKAAVIGSPFESIAAGFLHLGPTDGEVRDLANGPVDDGTTVDGRPQQFKAGVDDRVEEMLQPRARQPPGGVGERRAGGGGIDERQGNGRAGLGHRTAPGRMAD